MSTKKLFVIRNCYVRKIKIEKKEFVIIKQSKKHYLEEEKTDVRSIDL